MEFIFLNFLFLIFKKFGCKIIRLWDTKLVGQAIWVVLTNCEDNCIKNTHTHAHTHTHTHQPVNQHHVWFFSSSRSRGWVGGEAVCCLSFFWHRVFSIFKSRVLSRVLACKKWHQPKCGKRLVFWTQAFWHSFQLVTKVIAGTPTSKYMYLSGNTIFQCSTISRVLCPCPLARPKRNIFLFVSADFVVL